MTLLDFTINIAEKAGKLIIKESKKGLKVSQKAKNDLVTQIDKQSEEFLISTISSKFPDHAFLAEESNFKSPANIKKLSKSPYIWIIDPLDGTTNFVHGLKQYCISIGIFKNEFSESSKNFEYLNGELIASVIFAPVLNEIFYAEKNKGAFFNGKKIKVSETPKVEDSLLVTGFPPMGKQINLPYFSKMLDKCQAIRRLGSAALDLAYVACGRFDGYWEFGLSPWDIAAGALIVKEAGGKVSDTNGNTLDLFGRDTMASNGKIHPQMIKIFSKVD